MNSGTVSKSDYFSLVRQSLDHGVVLDWPAEERADVARERAKLAGLGKAERFQAGSPTQ
jgi:hypothetical protein